MATAHQRYSSEDRREQILEVSTDLFARLGYEGATTREIARGARVNEAIIFRHFPTKEDLYWAVIERKCRTNPGRELLRESLASLTDVRETFIEIAERILRRRHEDQTLTRLLLFSALENHRLSHRFFQTYVADYYVMVADFIQSKVTAGEFRPVDPQLAARAFLGMVIYHSMIQELFGGNETHFYDAHQAAEAMVDIWVAGVTNTKQPGEVTDKKRAAGKAKAQGQRK